MNDETVALLKLLGGGTGFGILLYIVYLIGTRMIASNDKNTERWASTVDKLGDKIDAHKLADVASHAAMQSDIAQLHGKIDGLLDGQDRYTPVGVEVPQPIEDRRRTPIGGVPIGGYSHVRPGTKGGR